MESPWQMLVLSRKVEERIFIRIPERENPIVIQVLRITEDGKVRIGISADRDMEIAREELLSDPNDNV